MMYQRGSVWLTITAEKGDQRKVRLILAHPLYHIPALQHLHCYLPGQSDHVRPLHLHSPHHRHHHSLGFLLPACLRITLTSSPASWPNELTSLLPVLQLHSMNINKKWEVTCVCVSTFPHIAPCEQRRRVGWVTTLHCSLHTYPQLLLVLATQLVNFPSGKWVEVNKCNLEEMNARAQHSKA